MSKHKPALPERLYYRLADAAKLIGCTTDDLLHYGACGYLEILSSVEYLWAVGTVFDSSKGYSVIATEPFSRFDFFAASRGGLKGIERQCKGEVYSANDLYLSVGKKFRRAIPVGDGRVTLKGESEGELPSMNYFSWKFTDSPEKIRIGDSVNQALQGEDCFVEPKIGSDNLWVRTNELCRFQKEGSTHVRVDFPTPDDLPQQHYRSDLLSYLNQAAAKFWANADPGDRSTHPDSKKVAYWLEGKGYSPSLAERGASIIRPEWAAVGRKPEE